MKDKKNKSIFILLSIFLFLFLISFASAPFGYNNRDLVIVREGATGNCPDGQFVQNITTGGIQCLTSSGSGDITGVTAGSGLTGGGSSGSVTLNVSATSCSAGQVSRYNGTHFTCETDATGAGGSYDLNITGNTGSGVITDSEIFNITGNGTALIRTYISGNDLIIEGTDTTGSGGGNTTEEMQDAVGSAFTGNLTYTDATPLFDINATNILAWLNGFYRRLSILITGSDIAVDSINTTHLIAGAVRDVDLNLTNITLLDFTNDADFTTNAIINNGSYLNSGSDSFVGNYSTFLTHINWSVASNGTLMFTSNWNATNLSYATASNLTDYTLLSVLNNGSYLNTASATGNYTILSFWANITDRPTTLSFFTNNLNIGNWTFDQPNYTLLTTLNNGSYFNSPSSGDITSVNTTLDYFLYNGSDSGDVFLRFNETRLNLSTYLLISNWNATNTSYYLASNPSNFITNATMNKSVNCLDISGGSDADFCSDAVGAGGGNTTEEMQDAVGNAFGNGLTYDDASNWFNQTDSSSVSNTTNSPNNFIQNITFNSFGDVLSVISGSVDFSAYTPLTILNNGSYLNTPHTLVNNITCSGTDKFSDYNNVTGAFVCSTDATGAGSFDLNITSQSGIGVITDSEEFGFTGAGSVTTSISGNNLTITGTDTNETARFDNLTAMDCGAGNVAIGVFANGTIVCAVDATGGVADVWVNETGEDWNRTRFIVPDINSSYTLGNTTKRYGTIYAITLDFFTQITTSQIADSIITTIKLADFAVTSVKIAFGAVNESHISSSSVNTTHIVDGTILSGDLNSDVNASLDTRFVNVAGDSMTGNLNLTTFNITTQGSGVVYSNSTCLKLRGATSLIEVC